MTLRRGHGLTERQREVLLFINAHRAKNQCNPPTVELAQNFGWASPNAAADHLASMARKGVLSFRPAKSRGYIIAYPWCDDR